MENDVKPDTRGLGQTARCTHAAFPTLILPGRENGGQKARGEFSSAGCVWELREKRESRKEMMGDFK